MNLSQVQRIYHFCDIFFDSICTTNFDFYLDKTLEISKRPISIIASENKISVSSYGTTKIIKLE